MSSTCANKCIPPFTHIVHGRILDLRKYQAVHPGGSAFLSRTLGVDCTALFESYHSPATKQHRMALLDKYCVGIVADSHSATDAQVNHPHLPHFPLAALVNRAVGLDSAPLGDMNLGYGEVLTPEWDFSPESFYATLRRKVWAATDGPRYMQKQYDLVVLLAAAAHWTCLLLMARAGWAVSVLTMPLVLFSGVLRSILFGAGHSYLHTKTHGRLDWLVDLSLTSSHRWRRVHLLHHQFTNHESDPDHQSLNKRLRSVPTRRYRLWYMLFANVYKRFQEGVSVALSSHDAVPARYILVRLYMLLEICAMSYFAAPTYLGSILFFNLYYQLALLAGHYCEWCQMDDANALQQDSSRDWGEHQIAVTNNIHLTGYGLLDIILLVGLNSHVEHHLFPNFNPFALVEANKIVVRECLAAGIAPPRSWGILEIWSKGVVHWLFSKPAAAKQSGKPALRRSGSHRGG